MPWTVYLKDDALAVLPIGCAFSRIATAGNSTFSWKFSSTGTDSGSVDFISGSCIFFFIAPGLLSREDTEDGSALFHLGWHLTHHRYLRRWTSDWPHLSFYKQISFLQMSFWASQLRACKVFQTVWSFLWLQFQLVRGLEIKSHLRFPSYLKI